MLLEKDDLNFRLLDVLRFTEKITEQRSGRVRSVRSLCGLSATHISIYKTKPSTCRAVISLCFRQTLRTRDVQAATT